MKTYIIYYKPRGAEGRFARENSITVRACSTKDAREEAYLSIGDCYKITKVKEVK